MMLGGVEFCDLCWLNFRRYSEATHKVFVRGKWSKLNGEIWACEEHFWHMLDKHLAGISGEGINAN